MVFSSTGESGAGEQTLAASVFGACAVASNLPAVSSAPAAVHARAAPACAADVDAPPLALPPAVPDAAAP